jgi:hypothetical protein
MYTDQGTNRTLCGIHPALVAWHEIEKQLHGDPVIAVNDDQGRILRQWEPVIFTEVQKRFSDVDALLASQWHCGSS